LINLFSPVQTPKTKGIRSALAVKGMNGNPPDQVGLFFKQGSGSIFLSFGSLRSKKSPPFTPCFPKFGKVLTVTKPTYPKRGFI
jgi:hypothetical protein